MDYKLVNGVNLAYIGDAYWSLIVRVYLINQGYTKANDLQKKTVKFVSAKAQAKIIQYLMDHELLNEELLDIYKRGRNAKVNSSPKNTDILTYHMSTGFEALIGYLYLTSQIEKIDEIFNLSKEEII